MSGVGHICCLIGCPISRTGLRSLDTFTRECLEPADLASQLISILFAGASGTRQGQLEESSVTQFAVQRSQSVWQELIGKLLPLTLDPGGL